MPFTLSHPAIILPLLKKNPKLISATGLIIGSMAPDLEYFSRMQILATYGHLWLNGLWFNVLISLIYCFVFHFFVRNVCIENLPTILFQRFSNFRKFNWNTHFKTHWFTVIISIVIGTYSHLFWDAFTHEWGFFAKQIPFLQKVWFNFGVEIKGFKFLQYFSSILGLIWIIFWMYKMPKNDNENMNFQPLFWIKIVILTLLISGLRFYFYPIEIMTGNLIVVPIMAAFISLLLIGFFK